MSTLDDGTPNDPEQDVPNNEDPPAAPEVGTPEHIKVLGEKTGFGDDITKWQKGYADLHGLVKGDANVVRLPGDSATDDERNEFYNKLGRPAEKDGYKLELGDTVKEDTVTWFRDAAHKAGLNQQQAQAFADGLSQLVSDRLDADQKSFDDQAQAAFETLKGEWGDKNNANMAVAKQGNALVAEALGDHIKDDQDRNVLDVIENAIGTERYIRLMHAIGGKLGEDVITGGETGKSGFEAMTAAEARQRLTDIQGDKDRALAVTDPQHPKHKDAIAEWKRLNEIAHAARKS